MDIKDLVRLPKDIIWETFSIFYNIDNFNYYSLTRKDMVSLIFSNYQNNPNKVYEILNEDELEILNNVYEMDFKEIDDSIVTFKDTYLLVLDNNFDIIDSLKESIKKGLAIYQNNKEEILKEKNKIYLLVGLLTAYGALTKKEIKYLYSLYYNDFSEALFDNLYFRRYVRKENSRTFVLNYVVKNKEYIQTLKTHTMPFKTLYSQEALISLGKYGYDETLKEFNVINNENIRNYLIRKRKFFSYLIGQNISYFILNDMVIKKYIQDDKHYRYLNRFILRSPKFLLSDNDNSIISKEEKDLYLDTIPDFIEYASRKYDIGIDNNDIYQSYFEIIGIVRENNFSSIDEYIEENILNDEQISLLKQFKNGKSGTYIVAKHTADGLIMLDDNNSYLVKAFVGDITKSTYPYPCMNYIFPYNGKIVSSDFVVDFSIEMPKPVVNEVKERLAVENVCKVLKERKYFGEVNLSSYFINHYRYGTERFTTQDELDYFIYLWDEVIEVCEEYKITSFDDLADLIGNIDIYRVLEQFCMKLDHSDVSLDYSKVMEYFRYFLKISTEPVIRINISNILAVLYFKENDSDSAEQVLTNLILDYPNIIEPYFNLVQGNLICGNKEKALYYFDLMKKNDKFKNSAEVKKIEKNLMEN